MKTGLDREEVHIRHVRRRQSGDTGGVSVLGDWFVAQPLKGINGEQGWQSGAYEPHEGEEGSFAISFPNSHGSDGVLHRRRFLVFTMGEDFREGDEFIEIYEGDAPGGRLLWVGMVTGGTKRRTIELRGYCAFPLLKHQRETRAGFWTGNAPRDVWENYSQVWQAIVADDFEDQSFVYSTAEQATPDGRWLYARAESMESVCNLQPNGANTAYLRGVKSFQPSVGGRWRLEAELERSTLATGQQLAVELLDAISPTILVQFVMTETGTFLNTDVHTSATTMDLKLDTEPGVLHVAIEGDRRWIYCYVNGTLKQVIPSFAFPAGPPIALVPRVRLVGTAAAPDSYVRVRQLLLRAHARYLLRGADKGDYRLPGAPTPGGLEATYFDHSDLATALGAAAYQHVLNPLRTPKQRRQGATVDYTGTTPNESARWVGAIYLDLAHWDIRLRVTADDRARVWVGKTRFGEQVIDDWTEAGHGAPTATTSAFLRSIFGSVSGWYPIVVEASNGSGVLRVLLEANKSIDPPSEWMVPGSTEPFAPALSRLGCFTQQVQGESHYEMLSTLRDAFGLQFTCEPRSLESGEFPGQLVPRIRLGRDTEYVLDDLRAVEPVVEVNAEEAVDELIVDGSGLSDPSQAAQQTQLAANFRALMAGRGMIHSEQESLSDISDLPLLQQRAESLLALRAAVWEEVQAQPEDKSRKLIDRFPLTDELAEFDWGVGDGLRLAFEDIDVVDELPRQLKVVSWPIRPDGRGAPAVSWRQRPRNFAQVLRRLVRLAQLPQRNYQGQFVSVPGSGGRHPAPTGVGGVTDNYSRVNLPEDLSRVVRADFVVQGKTTGDTSAMNIEINSVNRGSFTKAGRYDVTAFVGRSGAGEPRMVARATGGTGAAEYALELLVAV